MRRARVRHFVYMEIIRGCQMETITSRENAKIKYACRLREEEKLRTADGLFFAEGPKLCLELARAPMARNRAPWVPGVRIRFSSGSMLAPVKPERLAATWSRIFFLPRYGVYAWLPPSSKPYHAQGG